jgi:uncharacterized protein YggE
MTEQIVTLQMTVQQAAALKQLLDLALKAGGLQVIDGVGHFVRQLDQSVRVAMKTPLVSEQP